MARLTRSLVEPIARPLAQLLALAPDDGASGPVMKLTHVLWPVPEGTAPGTEIATIGVIGGTGSYVYSELADPDGKFAVVGASLRTAGTWDFDADADKAYSISLRGNNGAGSIVDRTFLVPIANVLEVTLVDLALDANAFLVGVPDSGSITGAVSGQTVAATGLPSGLTIDGAARTWAWDGTGAIGSGSIDFQGTHPDAAPHVNSFAYEIDAAPTQTFVTMLSHGDSRVVGVFAAEAGDVDIAGLSQYVEEDNDTPGTVAGGYPLTLGLTTDITPLQQAVAYNGTRYLSPVTHAAKRVLDDAGFFVDISAGGYNGQSVDDTGHTLGPLPDGVTAFNVGKGGHAFAARASASPSAAHVPIILTIDCTNDGGPDIDSLHAAKLQQLIDLRTATGFSAAPIVVVSRTPEYNATGETGPFIEAAQRVAALKTDDCYYCALPEGLGVLHEGQALSGDDIQLVRDAGYDHIGRTLLVALAQLDPAVPDFSSIPATTSVIGGSTSTVPLPCDQPVYYTGITVGGSDFELSDDLELAYQVLRPIGGGAWPAFDSGTPANNTKTVTIGYITGDRVVGTISRTIEIQEPSTVFNILYNGYSSTPLDFTAVAGRTYFIGTWSGSGVGIAGETVTELGSGAADPLRLFSCVAGSSGTKTVTPGSGCNVTQIIEVVGHTLNGSSAFMAAANRSGGFTAPSSLTDKGLAIVLSTSATPSLNMTGEALSASFLSIFTSNASLTPAGSWDGYTALAAVGLT